MLAQLSITFGEMMSNPGVISGIILVVVGLVMSIIATRLTRAIRKADKYDPNDKIAVTIKVFGLILILVGFILMAALSFNY